VRLRFTPARGNLGELVNTVVITKAAQKDLASVPAHVATKLAAWVAGVKSTSLEAVRKIPGYHDEPLAGKRKGQRSIRLSKGYRAFYVIKADGQVEFVSIEEVNKHLY
jgi:toxin HigB-1